MKNQFKLSSLIWLVTVVCAACALVVESNAFIQTIAGSVIAANILGAIVAVIVTHGFGMPRDGSYRYENKNKKSEPTDSLMDGEH